MTEPTAQSRSSFYLAMRVLPKDQREAMFSIYRFLSGGRRRRRRAAIRIAARAREGACQMARRISHALFEGQSRPEVADLESAVSRFALRREDFEAVIAGVEMDAEADIRAPDWATLDLYCDRVASAVGRLSVQVFGFGAQAGDALAFHLGRALQLTNILRDLDEDAAVGRLYLPREALAAARIVTDDASARRSTTRRVGSPAPRSPAAPAAISNARGPSSPRLPVRRRARRV